MADGHFVPSDTGSKPVVDIVFFNVIHDWVGSNRIVEVIFECSEMLHSSIKLDNYFDWRSWLHEIY